jgi:hypothetical protein
VAEKTPNPFDRDSPQLGHSGSIFLKVAKTDPAHCGGQEATAALLPSDIVQKPLKRSRRSIRRQDRLAAAPG